LHIALLGVLAVIDFSSSPSQALAASLPAISVKDITAVTQLSPVTPKPKVTPSKKTDRSQQDLSPFTNVIARTGLPDADRLSSNAMPSARSQVTFNRTEFFSSKTDVRKICFVVDRSASMLGTFNKVCNNLKDSIASLRQDQYFDVVFFGGGEIADFGNKKLMRASDKRKTTANEFIDSIKPKGTTDATAALIYAMTIKDSSGNGPQLIYFLTDGFDLNISGTNDISLIIENKRKTLAPSTIINTIGFQTELSDRKQLQAIAKNSGGKFVNID
jgi:hypothetical protein